MSTGLGEELRRIIKAEGPITVARFMALCLSHPVHGYYMRGDPFGRGGDFTTAPEISQIFGELLGLWTLALWEQMGAPERVLLVELGPGRGTLMADALRAARIAPAFLHAVSVHLVETSPTLRQRQGETLAGISVPVAWHETLETVPEGPLFAVANEFFDALPVHQAVRTADGWHGRCVGLDGEGRLAFGIAPFPLPGFEATLPPKVRDAPPGAIYEWRSDAIATELGRRIAAHGGAALVLDYGHGESGTGDTLQAVQRHAFADPLAEPGEADLTAHVNFAALRRAGSRAGAATYGPVGQGAFLRRLGLGERAAALKRNATAAQARDIDLAAARLAGSGRGEMGELFKALAFSSPGLGVPPGFDR